MSRKLDLYGIVDMGLRAMKRARISLYLRQPAHHANSAGAVFGKILNSHLRIQKKEKERM